VLRIGFFAGIIAGAVATILLTEPKDGEADTAEPQGVVDSLRRQLRQAQIAAREEGRAKEAEMLTDFEHARQAAEDRPNP
jgi:hypothetical protein